MLGWDLSSLNISDGSGIARAFEFEVVFTGSANQADCLLRGDGILLSSGRVRFNREDELKSLVAGTGGNPEYFLDYLSDWVVRQAHPRLARTA
jgi:hypothetical protein